MPRVSIHILHHRQKYSQILARTSDVHENATTTKSLVPKQELHWCFIQYRRARVETGFLLRPAKHHGQESVIGLIVITDSHRR